jgi:hypothetical protein
MKRIMRAERLSLKPLSGTRFIAASLALLATTVCSMDAIAQPIWDNPSGQIGSLSRENLAKEHRPHPVDLTGTYVPEGNFEFRPYPKLKPDAQALYDMTRQAQAEGRTFNDVTGACWPPGMPIIMTRVWPIHIVPVETAIIMIFNFNSQVRWIHTDGRIHSDPNITVPTYNGESIGLWQDDTLVVDTRNIETHQHYVDRLVPLSEQFRIVERIRSIDNGDRLQIEFTMTDPVNWEGEWVVTKTFLRQEKVDFVESQCLPNVNEGLPAMDDEYTQSLEERLQ